MSKLKIMKFGADWCGPCVNMEKSKTLEKFVDANPEISVEKIDIDENEQLADDFGVVSIPAVFVVDETGKVLAKANGGQSVGQLEKLVEKAKAKASKGTKKS